ncbi:MAG: glycyl-radical enzyme activating protein [Clostridiales bacterium]|nr:glycyl-radical enzyme activating protein [Clostridiales bacterium]
MISADMTGTVFNTQKFSIHDGTGIRTLIFMKGCPLRCIWCSNPESQRTGPEVMFVRSKCTGCGKCAALCREAAVDDVTFDIDRSRCVKCGLCTSKCYAGAKKMTGRQVTVREMMELIEKDRIFYTNSGGGVTVGGGEPAMQHGFVEELLKACRESHIHTAIETCGYGRWQDICGMFDNADQIFFDLKAIDPELHRRLTGVSNELILHNAEQAAVRGKDVIFRIPLIPGCNDSLTNIEETGIFVGGLSGNGSNVSIEILPYHDLGRDKYRWLDMDYGLEDTGKPDATQVEELKTILKDHGCSVV